MPTPATIGFRAHSGWAAAVALAGPVEGPGVITRRRLEMRDRGKPGPTQPYHAAVGLEIREAERVVADCAERAASLAAMALHGIVTDLKHLGHKTTACGLLLASGRTLPPLEKILASHPLLHTAEGELFRDALRSAAAACGLPVTAARERELLATAAAELRISPKQIEDRLAQMGRALGPPWRQDEKLATVMAWLALARGVHGF